MNKISICITALLLSASLSTSYAATAEGEFLSIYWKKGGSHSRTSITPSVLKLEMDDGTVCYALTDGTAPPLFKSFSQFQGLGCVK